MKITWQDGAATLLVTAVIVEFGGHLAGAATPLIADPRGMAATGLALGLAAVAVLGRRAFRGAWGIAAGTLAVLSGAVGVVTVIRAHEGAVSEGLLAAFIATLALTWLLAELVSTGLVRPDASTAGAPPRPAPAEQPAVMSMTVVSAWFVARGGEDEERSRRPRDERLGLHAHERQHDPVLDLDHPWHDRARPVPPADR